MQQDNSTFPGATTLAKRIETHWMNAGYTGIVTRVETLRCGETGYIPIWVVRSNIGPHGYPPVAAPL